MTTSDVPDTATGTAAASRLDDGPLGQAMAALDRAVADIEEAEAALVVRRRELSAALGRELRAVLEAAPEDVVAQVRPTLAALYWERADVVRVQDLTDATGLSGAQLRKVVGPRVVEVSCDVCGHPSEVVQSSRSQPLRTLCPACRWAAPPRYRRSPWAADVPAGALDRLVDDLETADVASRCDGRLTLTRSWAAASGLDPEALVATVESYGGYCDCEVVDNVPVRSR